MEDLEISEDEVALVEEIRGENKRKPSLNQKKLRSDELDELFG